MKVEARVPAASSASSPAEQREVRIETSDGVSLAASIASPQGAEEPAAVLLINSATGVRRSFYARFGEHLATRGIAVVTYDYRGIGDSLDRPIAKYNATMTDWGKRDFEAALNYVFERFPSVPVFGLGHSVGGQIYGLSPESRRLRGIIGVAAQSGYWWLSPTRARMWLNWHVILPGLVSVFGYLPGWAGVGADLPKGVALEWARWCRARDFFVDEAGARLATHFSEVRSPVLWCSIEGDPYAPAAAVEWIAKHFDQSLVERRTLRGSQFGTGPIGHFKLFTPKYKQAWDEVADWLTTQTRARGRA